MENNIDRDAIVARLAKGESATVLAREVGRSPRTVYQWAKDRNVDLTCRNEKTRAANQAVALRWEERRSKMIHDMGEVAALTLEKIREKVQDGKLRDAAAGTTCLGTLIDKAQLLCGGATSRPHPQTGDLLNEGKGKVLDLVPQRKVG